MNDPKIIVALDYDNQQDVIALVDKLDSRLCRLKVGKELFTSCGPDIVKCIQGYGFDVFLDLKFHDIPVTVAKACRSAANLGVWMLNVHALGGASMLEAARDAVDDCENSPHLIAVTILTSMDAGQLSGIGIQAELDKQVLKLATLAKISRLNGVVCSALEAKFLKKALGGEFTLVTPGIRPQGSAHDDQKRIMTPEMALENGADYLVIGRPITQASDPLSVLRHIQSSMDSK